MSRVSRRSLFRLAGLAGLFSFGAVNSANAAVKKPKNKTVEADIVVVGAGCAGLVAAIRGHDQGANVVVVEKADRPDGNAIYALGTLCGWGTKWQKECGLEDSREAFYNDMMKVSAGRGDPKLTMTYTDNIAEAIDWLQDEIGVKFEKITNTPWPRLGRGHRTAAPKGFTGGGSLIQQLLKAAEQRKIPFFYEHKAVQLLTNDKGEVIGVRTLTDDEGYVDFLAKGGVLISSGGFSANPEMTDKYIGGWAAKLALRGSRNTTGENVSLCLPLFAKMVNMDQFHAGPIIASTHVNPADVLNAMQGIIVDLRGNRFMDEQNTYVIKAKDCARNTLENKAYCIVDSQCKVLSKVIPKFDHLHNPYGKADTIEALCEQVGLPVDAVKANVDAYNKAVDQGTLGQMNPPNSYRKPVKLEVPPYYAVPYEGGMTATFGGPLINSKAQVVTNENKPIPGLYAAGNAAGGLFYNDYIGGAQLGGASVFGTIAAREMANRAKKAKESKK